MPITISSLPSKRGKFTSAISTLISFVLFALSSTSPANAQAFSTIDISSPGTGERLNAHLQQLQAKGFSGAIIVEQNGQKILQAGYGFADIEKKAPYTSRTVNDVGSLAKQFTAAAIVALSQKGYFKLHDSLGAFFPSLRPPQAYITIHQVLTHSAGLSEYAGRDFAPLSQKRFLRHVRRKPLKFEPGEAFFYSNTGYSVLALLIEKVTGKEYEKVVSGILFERGKLKVGLNLPDFKETELASNYGKKRKYGSSYFKARAMKDAFWVLKGNGSFYASAQEMHKWFKTLYTDSFIDQAVRNALLAPHFKREEHLFYGYGWHVRTDSSGKVKQISHAGSDDIMSAYWMELPQDKVWIYIISNTSAFKATSITLDILKLIRADAR